MTNKNKPTKEDILKMEQQICCKMIIAELENIKEQLCVFIDKMIDDEIKNFNMD